jgi:tetratricopeptide (TPR) repeat protein
LGTQGKYELAILQLDKAVEEKPDYLEALIERGFNRMNLSKYAEAINDFEKALTIDPTNTLALYDIGCCKYNLEDYVGAIKYYNKALDTKGRQTITLDWTHNPNFPNPKVDFDVQAVEIIYFRANSYSELDSLRLAYFDYKHCIDNNYEVASSYYKIAYLYFASGKNKLGCEALNKAIGNGRKDINPEHLKLCETE